MPELISLHVKGRNDVIAVPSEMPLLHALRNDLHLNAPERNQCGCGTYNRIVHAIARPARLLCTEKAR
ncbi:MAG: hypothetical protein QOK44_6011 [Betaproteobacteria bacterium]|jgi:aerobic-type carbon monoxide dehydrogenase small subunit (CoxS/CutS family)|nr:hypothetical protein [Betaproteobacteria bacterium]